MPRGRRKSRKLNIKGGTIKSVLALLLLCFSVLTFVSFFSSSGAVLFQIKKLLLSYFGYNSFLFSLICAYLAVLLLNFIESRFISYRSFLGLILAFFSSSAIFNYLVSERSSGKIGALLSDILTENLSIYGGIITAFSLFLVALIIIFDVSFSQISTFLKLMKEKIVTTFSNLIPKKQFSSFETSNTNFSPNGEESFEENIKAVKKTKKQKEPVIEVIPSVSEPIDESLKTLESKSSRVKDVTPGLPYTDKVWEYPPIDLLSDVAVTSADRGDVKQRQHTIEETLNSFGIKARVAEINFGPAVTQYALETVSGTKIAKITNLQNDLALALSSPTGSVRIEAPIPGKPYVGIEVPNVSTALVSFKSIITSDVMKNAKSKLTIALGHNVSGLSCVADISKMPHLLIAGSTGSGKSVFIHSLLFSLLFRCSPAECKLILVDPKRVELVNYNDIPHLLVPVITDADKSPAAFKWAVAEMERRYKLFESAKVRNINAYNELSGFQALPFIVIIVDELAELMALAAGEMERAICRLAQLSRATGIHLILATQRPSVDVLTGLIKANIPTRAAFNVTSQIDSRVIIDMAGAEKLLGKGDMLYVPPESSKPIRIQGVFVTDKEITNLVNFLKNSGVEPEYRDEVMKPASVKEVTSEGTDELFDEAVKIVSLSDRASASLLQRKLSIGYARAARLLDELEARGIVGAADGSKPRDILVRPTDPPSLS